jgi:hypothetical protein
LSTPPLAPLNELTRTVASVAAGETSPLSKRVSNNLSQALPRVHRDRPCIGPMPRQCSIAWVNLELAVKGSGVRFPSAPLCDVSGHRSHLCRVIVRVWSGVGSRGWGRGRVGGSVRRCLRR